MPSRKENQLETELSIYPKQVYSIDMDGVLADFVLDFTQIANRLFGTPVISTHSQTTWDLTETLTGEQCAAVWAEIDGSPSFWLDLKPLATWPELDLLHSLDHDGNTEIQFLTARELGVDPKRQTEGWLIGSGFCAPKVHLVTASDKVTRALEYRVNVLLDDDPTICAGAIAAGIPHVYLMSRRYNQEAPTTIGVKRVGAMIEFFWLEHQRRLAEWNAHESTEGGLTNVA